MKANVNTWEYFAPTKFMLTKMLAYHAWLMLLLLAKVALMLLLKLSYLMKT